MEPSLVNGLPLIDILVLDEADRMVADGHFKELDKILNHIYTKRVEIKKKGALKPASQKAVSSDVKGKLMNTVDAAKAGGFKTEMMKTDKKIDVSKIVDLDDEFDEGEDIVVDLENNEDFRTESDMAERSKKQKEFAKQRKQARLQEESNAELDKEKFDKDYLKVGGIQHIICSATMTIDNMGRITPRKQKIMDKKKEDVKTMESTLEALCHRLRFRSKTPKVIDMNDGEQSIMPETLRE